MKLYGPPTKEFFRMPNNIFDLGLTPIQFTLYSYLVSCAGSSTIWWPSLKTICAKTVIGLTAVQDHLKVLEKRQIIQIGKRKTRNGNWNNEYTLAGFCYLAIFFFRLFVSNSKIIDTKRPFQNEAVFLCSACCGGSTSRA